MENKLVGVLCSTETLWELVTGNQGGGTMRDVTKIIGALFPGLELEWVGHQEIIFPKLLKPEISKQYPKLNKFKSSFHASETLGKEIELTPVKLIKRKKWVFQLIPI